MFLFLMDGEGEVGGSGGVAVGGGMGGVVENGESGTSLFVCQPEFDSTVT